MRLRTSPENPAARPLRDPFRALERIRAFRVGKRAEYATEILKKSAESPIGRVLRPNGREAGLSGRPDAEKSREEGEKCRVQPSAAGAAAQKVENKASWSRTRFLTRRHGIAAGREGLHVAYSS